MSSESRQGLQLFEHRNHGGEILYNRAVQFVKDEVRFGRSDSKWPNGARAIAVFVVDWPSSAGLKDRGHFGVIDGRYYPMSHAVAILDNKLTSRRFGGRV